MLFWYIYFDISQLATIRAIILAASSPTIIEFACQNYFSFGVLFVHVLFILTWWGLLYLYLIKLLTLLSLIQTKGYIVIVFSWDVLATLDAGVRFVYYVEGISFAVGVVRAASGIYI